MDSTTPHIGCEISLISNACVRYTGTLDTLDSETSQIILSNVRCHGTENRTQALVRILPAEETFDSVSFRGEDIQDLQVTARQQSAPLSPQASQYSEFDFSNARINKWAGPPSQYIEHGPAYGSDFYDRFNIDDPKPNKENRLRNSDTFGQSVVNEHLTATRTTRGKRGRFRGARRPHWQGENQ